MSPDFRSRETENALPVVVILTAVPVEYQAVKACVEDIKEDETEDVFSVYILSFENGSYYIGHSRELKGRMLEIRNDPTVLGFGMDPKLQYFEIHSNLQSAMNREAEIKKLYQNNSREISGMISHFTGLIKELDFD